MKLGSEFKIYTVSQNTTLNVVELIDDCLDFLHSIDLDQETIEKVSEVEQKIRQTEELDNIDKTYRRKKEILFHISPEGSYFGTHPTDLALIGFWNKNLFSVTR